MTNVWCIAVLYVKDISGIFILSRLCVAVSVSSALLWILIMDLSFLKLVETACYIDSYMRYLSCVFIELCVGDLGI